MLLMTSMLGLQAAPVANDPVVSLPSPRLDGRVSVERALKHRRSIRNPDESPLMLADLGQLCWAAQGVTDDKGHRTAPSAMATYPLDLYVIVGAVRKLLPGLYHYEPTTHSLRSVMPGDKRYSFTQKAVGQAWISKAPAIFVIVGSTKKMEKVGSRKEQFMATEAGLAAQGFFLQAEAMGLGSTFVGGFDPNKARKELGLKYDEQILAVLPVGKRP